VNPHRRVTPCVLVVLAVLVSAAFPRSSSGTGGPVVYRVDHVTDGDTIALRNGQRVRLVQIDTPEVFFGVECYVPQASATAWAEAMKVGRDADVKQLLEAALLEAETAVAAAGTHEGGDR
jgi:hypothetical protein